MSNKSLKVLDENGVKHLWSKISMEDYPNNEVLIAALEAIDETKIDKEKIGDLTTLTTTEQESITGAINEVNEKASTIVDWNQIDETATDYIKNRTHYYNDNSSIIIDTTSMVLNTDVEITVQEDIFNDVTYARYVLTLLNTDINIVEGEQYEVTLNGKIYTCVGSYVAINTHMITGLGYYDEDLDGRFKVASVANLIEIDSNLLPPDIDFTTTVPVVTVKHISHELKQLDEKFIPDTIARTSDIPQSDWAESDESSLSYIKNKTHYYEYTNDESTVEELLNVNSDNMENPEDFYIDDTFSFSDVPYTAIFINPNIVRLENEKRYRLSTYSFSVDVDTKSAKSESENVFKEIIYCGNLELIDNKKHDPEVPYLIESWYENGLIIETCIFIATECITDNDYISVSLSFIHQIVHQLDKKYIPNAVIGDWNENDKSKLNYIKNRTHYTIKDETILIKENNINIMHNEEYNCAMGIIGYIETIVADNIYHITLNDVEYECIARKFEGNSIIVGNGTIGNIGDGNSSNNEPFYYTWMPWGEITLYIEEAGTYDIKISIVEGETVKQLDEKYIPDTIARTSDIPQSDWNEIDESSAAYIQNRTHYYYEGIASVTKEFVATGPEGGHITDVEFATQLLADYDKATYVANGSECTVSTELTTSDDGSLHTYRLTPVDSGNRNQWKITIYINTGEVVFGDDGQGNFGTGSITLDMQISELKQLDEKYIPDTIARTEEVTSSINEINDTLNSRITLDSVILTDAITGDLYKIQIQNGQLVSFLVESESAEEEVTTS